MKKKKYVKCYSLGILLYIPLEEAKEILLVPISEEDILELTDYELAELEGRL